LLGTLEELFPERINDGLKVLLPGAGLGRLGHEIAGLKGFEVTTNEWSMYMNLLYRFLTSSPSITTSSSTAFHPFLDSFSHHLRPSSQTRQLSFPDTSIRPSSILLTEGDFTSVFTEHKDTYDVVLTYFFIDTARNLMGYLETIKRVLKPGGYWINLGPLLYGTAPFVQLSLEEIVTISEVLGFEFLETEGEKCGVPTFEGKKTVRGMEAVYSFDDLQLTKSAYLAQFWVAQLSS
jgi:carnosine N-methyltransferase